jgi:hypothetical protein
MVPGQRPGSLAPLNVPLFREIGKRRLTAFIRSPNPDKPEPNLPRRQQGSKNAKSINRKEAQKAQRIPFSFASLAFSCDKYSCQF